MKKEKKERHCLRCGRTDAEVKFPTPRSILCVPCHAEIDEERKRYHKIYHEARGMAVKQLIAENEDRYKVLLRKAREKLKKQSKKTAK